MSWISRAFGKKNDTQWWVGTFEEDGKPVVVRARSAIPATPDPKQYPALAVITWNYEGDDSGMPSSQDALRMSELEDTLETKLETKRVCIQTASRTGNGRREWNYYARGEEDFMTALNRALGHLPPFPIEIQFFPRAGLGFVPRPAFVERMKRPNKAPEPTPGPVTPRAEPRVAPAPSVAHL